MRENNNFPFPCNLCGSQEKLARLRVKQWIDELAKDNPKIPSNILHALQSVKPSQLMDSRLWNFRNLKAEQQLVTDNEVEKDLEIITELYEP